MIRKIVVPQERTYVLELPEEFVGKEVEVLAFKVNGEPHTQSPLVQEKAERLQQIQDTFSKYRIDMSDFTFDRDEANNYE